METESVDFFDEPKPMLDAHRQALARMYADEGVRAYLENAMRVANQNAMLLLESGDADRAKSYAARYKSIKQILTKGKEYFIHFHQLRGLKEPLREV